MADVPQHLWHLCQQLQQQNLQPSVALLRSHSQIPVSIQQAVKAIQRWKANPQAMEDASSRISKAERKIPEAEQAEPLAARVARLEQQVAELTAQLAQLTNNHQT